MNPLSDNSSTREDLKLSYSHIVESLRTGGFAAHVPHLIDTDWDERYKPLVGFPISVCYRGVRPMIPDNSPVLVTACYTFDPATYKEAAEFKELYYFGQQSTPYLVRVRCHLASDSWEVSKLREEEVIVHAFGQSPVAATIHATLNGLEPDEPAYPEKGFRMTGTRGVVIVTQTAALAPISPGMNHGVA